MLRREAVLVLREICECIPDESAVNFVSLKPAKQTRAFKSRQYDLHIKMSVDKCTLERIESVTRRRGLSLEESDGKLIVSAPKELIEIVV